jgi:hypothetical protein
VATNTNPLQSPKSAFPVALATFQAFCAAVFAIVAPVLATSATVALVVAAVVAAIFICFNL